MFERYNNRNRSLTYIGVGLFVIGLTALVVYCATRRIEGIAKSVVDLPKFASILPTESQIVNIRYLYEPWTHRLLLSGRGNDADVDRLLKHWNFTSVEYANWDGSLDYAFDTPAYQPTAGRMRIGFGKLPNSGRLNTWVYYKPDDYGGGSMIIHVY